MQQAEFEFLQATNFIDSDTPAVQAFARRSIEGAITARDKAVKLYYAVRDDIRYDPYSFSLDAADYKASRVLAAGTGFCVPKAILLTAVARAVDIPAAVGFADVRNHLNTEKLYKAMGTDVFIYHGYTALFLDGEWVKATPAFNIELCQRFGVLALEFDGKNDALFHPYDAHDRRHMEYLQDRGWFADVPFEQMIEDFKSTYPNFEKLSNFKDHTRFEEEKPLMG